MKQVKEITRRDFLAVGTAAAAAISGFPFVSSVRGQQAKPIKVGLIGCGGRGTGAAANAITAAPNVHLTAMADRSCFEQSISKEKMIYENAGAPKFYHKGG